MVRSSILALALIAGSLVLSTKAAVADPVPEGWQAQNMSVVGYSGLAGRPGGFKIAVKQAGGRWYLYLGHLWNTGWSIVDVTDPADPRYVRFIPGPPDMRTTQVSLHGDLWITAIQKPFVWPGMPPEKIFDGPSVVRPEAGVALWDISNPTHPKLLSQWTGADTHRNSYPGRRYAYLSVRMPGYTGSGIMVTLDVSDPRRPKEVGRWSYPGQREGEAPVSEVPPGFHGPVNVSPDGKRAALGYQPSVVNLDIADPAHPRMLGELKLIPPFIFAGSRSPQSVHTVLPLWDRDLLFASSEQMAENCTSQPMNFALLIDNKDPAKPRPISMLPTPRPPPGARYRNFCDRGGRFGPHNTSQEIHSPDVQKPGRYLPVTWFTAGLRIFDIDDPYLPTEVAWFLPPTPTKRIGSTPRTVLQSSSEDVLVDARGYMYVTDKQWGLWILKHTPPATP